MIGLLADGLTEYLKCAVVRSNQNMPMPKFPYILFTITQLASENKGTWQEGIDTARKEYTQTVSFTAHSDNYSEAVELANKCRDWLDFVGKPYLDEHNIIVKSVGAISDRSSLLSTDYMYSYGFDCFLRIYRTVQQPERGVIETVKLQNEEYS